MAGEVESPNLLLNLQQIELKASIEFNKILQDIRQGKTTLQEAKREWGVV